MMTPDGPRVLEFNTRFGDPETQALLPRLDEDALALLTAAADGELTDRPVRVNDGAAVAVVLAAHGYPGHAPVPATSSRASRRPPRPGRGGVPRGHGAGRRRHHRDGRRPRAGRERAGRQRRRRARRAYAAAELVRFDGRQMRGDIASGMETEGGAA